ncbi:2-C-methyl-D-erythritol 2,4-cyclodiphosphate synthase [Cucumis melo var. makuwa]|uniref:2-C-methyl-D-erythritol 2,4-cyclodiphosphate synthase n=1 Tax=Cucumis melo var. makuwa TaxID=1194695 RepID=A0A5A7TSJ1_CUCMM|nr:2-C-methyl-D-erythritol 2,4-cyclodiphosphate synthase [Cucumis melo var. makuwa]
MAVSAPFFASPPAATTSHQSPSLSFYPPSFPRRIFTPLSSSSSLPSFRVNSAVSHSVSSTTAIKSDSPSKTLPFRVGHGFDLHRLEPGILCYVNFCYIFDNPWDGDVLLHCVVDAILGALGLPDIGQIFPDSDPKWKGAPSSVFIKEAVRLMHEAGYDIGNLDATLILQRPKLSPHKEAIRANLSELLGADPSVVNLKAKTHEKVDSLGENRSIAAHTVVLLMRR